MQDRHADIIGPQLFSRLQRAHGHQPGGDNQHIVAVLQQLRLTQFELIVIFIQHQRHLTAQQTHIHRPLVIGNGRYRLLYLQRIARIDDNHPGDTAHDRQIFGGLMAGAIAGRQARQRRADLHVQMLFGDDLVNKIIGATGCKGGIGGGERNKSLLRHPPCRRHQQLFGHAHLEKAIREGLGENMQVGIF